MELALSAWALIMTCVAACLVMRDISWHIKLNGMSDYCESLEQELNRFMPPRTSQKRREVIDEA